MTNNIIITAKANSAFTDSGELDYKTLDYMLHNKNAEEFDSAESLFKTYDAKDTESKTGIEEAKSPLYVLHNVEDAGLVFVYAPVYDASLNLVGFLD
jgi:predicted protein tyrosine phosphatase